jgi:hypothetical protein
MNTKGMKFLAVLAVLAMAFAAFAVMTDTEQNSAAIPEEVKTVSTEPEFRAAITGTEEFNVQLGADIVINSAASGYLVKSAGVIDFNGHTITVKVPLTAVSPTDITQTKGVKSIIMNESSGLTLKDSSSEGKGGIINAYSVESTSAYPSAVLYNVPTGVMTIDSGSYTVDNGKIEPRAVTDKKTYWYTVVNEGDMTINGGYIAGMNHWWADPSTGGNQKISSVIVNGDDARADATLVINGGVFEYGGYTKLSTNGTATINGGTFKNGLTGAIMNYGESVINSATFEGMKTDVLNYTYNAGGEVGVGYLYLGCDLDITRLVNKDGATLAIGPADINIEKVEEGSTGTIKLKDSAEVKFAENTVLPSAFKYEYMDEYNDSHSFQSSEDLDVGMGGFTISAGNNTLFVDGTVTLTDATTYTCTGNVTLSGMVYTLPKATPSATEGKNLTLVNTTKDLKNTLMPADIKVGNFQVTDSTAKPGSVILESSILVEAGCSFYVAGDLTIGVAASGSGQDAVAGSEAILKIAEGAVVKPEGALTIANGSIWNAGQFIAIDYKDGAYDAQLIRVFMSTSYQTGTFYKGASVYDGTMPVTTSVNSNATGQSPLTIAFGAYLDLTGIDKINLTSGGINVNSALYKYNTLILATFTNTIALTASYDNQYAVTVMLDGKTSAAPVMTAKSATIRNVVWDSPISATIYVTAPEVYTVILAKEIKETDDGWVVKTDSGNKPIVWTSGLTIKDQDGRVIPISSVGDTIGQVQLVYGYEYTIEGANSTSNYKFEAPNKDLVDLTKDSKTTGSFTMIRDNLTPTTPVVLYVTEGYATELSVVLTYPLNKDYEQFKEGDVIVYYTTEVNEKGEPTGDGIPVTLKSVKIDNKSYLAGVIKDNLYSNDTIYFMSEYRLYFKLTSSNETGSITSKVVFPDKPASSPVVKLTSEDFKTDKWSLGYTFDGITNEANKAVLQVVCDYDIVVMTFDLDTEDMGNDHFVYVEFDEYCGDTNVHAQKEKLSADKEIKMCVGEVYRIYWDPIDGMFTTMTFVKTGVENDTPKSYTEDTPVIVSPTELTYTFVAEPIYYMTVVNETSYDLTISVGQFSANVPANGENDSVIINEGDKNPVILSKKGYGIEDFTFTYQTNSSATPSVNVYVSGPMTVKVLVKPTGGSVEGYFDAFPTGESDDYILTIKQAHVKKTLYSVDVLKDDHGAIGDRDQNGYMGDTMKAFVSAQGGYNVVGVTYEYQEVDMPEKAIGYAERSYTSEGQEVWIYTMPASDVLLKPIIYKETRELSFVDQNGEVIETSDVEPTTEIFMLVPHDALTEIVSVTTDDLDETEYDYNADTGYISFVMPDKNVEFVVTCKKIDYSTDVLVTIGQRGAAITLVITALDLKQIAPGEIDMIVWYSYVNEFGDLSVDSVEVTKTYVADGSTHYVIIDETFIEELGDNYAGAFAAEGSFELGEATGYMKKTEYNPVLGA